MKELRSFINLLSSDIIQDPPVLIQIRLDILSVDISYVIRYPLVENILKWKLRDYNYKSQQMVNDIPLAGSTYYAPAQCFCQQHKHYNNKSKHIHQHDKPSSKASKELMIFWCLPTSVTCQWFFQPASDVNNCLSTTNTQEVMSNKKQGSQVKQVQTAKC